MFMTCLTAPIRCFDASVNLGSERCRPRRELGPNGKTYYGTQFYRGVGGIMSVIDVFQIRLIPKLMMN